MSQGPCPAAEADLGAAPNGLAMPTTIHTTAMSALTVLQLNKCTFETDSFTSLRPFHLLKMVYSYDIADRVAPPLEGDLTRMVTEKVIAGSTSGCCRQCKSRFLPRCRWRCHLHSRRGTNQTRGPPPCHQS